MEEPAFQKWIPLANQVVRRTLGLRWKDVFEIYSYIPTIPLAEALALEARRAGSDTHITLMTDDLWFTSMRELTTRWLSSPSPVESAIDGTITANVYLGGPGDARKMRDVPPEKFEANSLGGTRQHEPRRRRRVRDVDLSIGRVTPERAEAYDLDYGRWRSNYENALAVDLKDISSAGKALARSLTGRRKVRIRSDAGSDLRFTTKPLPPLVSDGIIDAADVRRGLVETSLPAGRVEVAIEPTSVEGEVRASDPMFAMGRTIRGTWYEVHGGRIVASGAEENGELLGRLLASAKVPKTRIGWFSVGLNPAAEPVMLDNSIVKDDIGIGLGAHPQLERKAAEADPAAGLYDAIGVASLEITK